MRIIFAGSSAFGLPALQMLLEHEDIPLVISQPDKPSGRELRLRPCPVAEVALQRQLSLFQPEDINSSDSVNRIKALAPDLLITASYGGLIKRELRQLPRLGAVNLHPSLLPSYRGATPIQTALLNGDKVTGVTIFRLNARLDAGPILIQREAPIGETDDFGSLHDQLAILSAELLKDLLTRLKAGPVIDLAQDDAAASHTRKLEKRDLILDWDQPASEVWNRIRAFSPQPGAQTFLRGKALKVLRAQLVTKPATSVPGSVAESVRNEGLEINCRDHRLLLLRVQSAGKKAMDAWSWQIGARLIPGDSFDPIPPSQPSSPLREET